MSCSQPQLQKHKNSSFLLPANKKKSLSAASCTRKINYNVKIFHAKKEREKIEREKKLNEICERSLIAPRYCANRHSQAPDLHGKFSLIFI
jgi:hypothetical protein